MKVYPSLWHLQMNANLLASRLITIKPSHLHPPGHVHKLQTL